MKGAGLAAVVALSALALAACGPAGDGPSSWPSAAERAALDREPVAGDLAVSLRVPAEGTVVPWSFPAPTVAWEDAFAANVFRVRLRDAAGGLLAEHHVHQQRRLPVPAADWERLRAAAGEGGEFEVELVAASLMPDGTLLRGPVRVVARSRFSAAGEHPTGHVDYGWKVRPPGAGPRPVPPVQRGIVPMRVAMDGTVERLLEDIPGIEAMRLDHRLRHPELPVPDPLRVPLPDTPAEGRASRSANLSSLERSEGQPGWAGLPHPPAWGCVACHTVSPDGRHVAAITQSEPAKPHDWDSAAGTIYVIRLPGREVVRQVPVGIFPRFDPSHPGRFAYASASGSQAVKQRVTVYRSDIRVLDIDTGEDRPVPGADDPERCELFPDWSPDGRTLVFARSAAPRQPCEGSWGAYDLLTVPWNDGRGGTPTLVAGASGNGVSQQQPRFSPDGRWILYFRAPRGFFAVGGSDLWVVPAGGGEAHPLSVSTPATEGWHAFSPDGRWIAFVTNRDRVDRPRGYVARFFPDGTTAAPLPLPGAGDEDAYVHTLDWAP